MQALEKLGIGDFLRSYAVTDALPRQTPTLADVGQSYQEQGILGGAREAAAFAAGNIVEQTPNILASIATGGTLSAAGVPLKLATVAAPFLTTLPVETGGAFREIEERTGRADPTTAAIAMGVGGINAALESASDAPILGWAMKPVKTAITAPLARSVGRVVGGALGETATEAGQELVTATAPELVGAERDPNLGMRALEAGAAGFVSGVPFAGAAEFQARRNEARYGTPAEGTPPVIQSDFDRAALSAQDQVAQVRQQADFAFTEAEKQAGFRLNEIDAQRQGVITQNQLNELEVNRLNLGAAAAKLNVLADLVEARSNIDGAVGQAEQTAAPVVEAAAVAANLGANLQAQQQAAPPPPIADTPAVPLSSAPSTRMSARATTPSPPPPQREGRSTDKRDQWDEAYGDMRRGGRTHNDDGTPYQPTVLDETMREVNQEVGLDPEAPIRVAGVDSATGIGNRIGQMIDAGWVWDPNQKRMVNPSNPSQRASQFGQASTTPPAAQAPIPSSAVDALAQLEAQANPAPTQFPAAPRPIAADPVPDLASILSADQMARLRAARVRDALPDAEVGLTEAVDTTTVTSPVDEAVMAKPGSSTPIVGEQATPPTPTLPRPLVQALLSNAQRVVPSGPKNAEFRQAVMAAIGRPVSKAKAGVNDVNQALAQYLGVDLNDTAAGVESKMRATLEGILAAPTPAPQVATPTTPSRPRSPLAKRKALGAAGKQAKRMAAMGSDALKDLDNLTPEEGLQVAWQEGRQETRDPRATETNKTRFINFASQIDGVINGNTLVNDMRSNDVAMTRIKDAVMREAVKSFEKAQETGTEWTIPFAMQAAQMKIRQEANNIRRTKGFTASQPVSLTTDEGNQSDVTDDEPIPPDAMDDQDSMDEVGAMTLQGVITDAAAANNLSDVERIALYYRAFSEQRGQKEAAKLLPGIPALVRELALTDKIDTIFKRDVLPKVGDLLKSITTNLKFALPQAQVVEAITAAFGSVPESVTIIDDPNHVLPDGKSGAGVAGYIVRSTGEITLNAAYIDSPMRAVMTLTEEFVHKVWDNPLIQGAWKTVLATVTQKEIQTKVDDGYPVEQAREEVAVAKVLDYVTENNPTPGVIENFLSTLWGKLKELFGLGPQLDQARNEILQKAFEAMREGSQTNTQDAAYMAAVERGDTETAQRMVDEAAKRAGYNVGPVFHGTQSNKRFNTFVGMWNYRFEAEKGTSYFTDNMDVAKGYGVRVIPAYLKMENPLVIDAKGEHWTIVSPSALVRARKQGNDGVIIQNVMDVPAGVPEQLATVYATFTSDAPSQIKSADPITYDDSGAVIPLSRRFDEGSQDIRFALAKQESAIASLRNQFRKTGLITVKQAKDMLGTMPGYLKAVVEFMATQREKAINGAFTRGDIAKAYLITLGSIGASAINVSTFERKTGMVIPSEFKTVENGVEKIRPEEAVALWFESENGQKALPAIEQGEANSTDFDDLLRIRDAFGRNEIRNNGLRIGGKGKTISDIAEITDAINAAKGDVAAIGEAVSSLTGIGPGKLGFIKHLLGFGDSATIDAVELNFWITGQGKTNQLDNKRADLVRKIKSEGKSAAFQQEVATRIENQIKRLAAEYGLDDRYAVHVVHHWLWDMAKKVETTHTGMMKAMTAPAMGSVAPGDIRKSLTSGWFVNQQTAQIAIARAQQQGADPTTIADVAQVEGELIPRSTVDTLERFSKGTKIQQAAASIAKILFDVGNLANASWLAAFPVSNPTARSASDLPETSRQLAAEAVLRASLAIDKRFDDLKQRRDAAVEELEAAILDLPKASEARNDAMVAEAEGQNLLRGLEVYLGNLLTASKSTPLDAEANASILEASRRVAEAKRDIGPGIGNALSNIAREMPDSVTSNAAILTWIRDRMADKTQPSIMGQAVADFLTTQLPGRRGLPIQQVNLSELIGELKQYRDAKALAGQEIDKFRKDTAGVTKTGKGKKVSVKTAAIRYANFREEYRNALTVAKKIDKRVERANEKIQAITLALQVIEETVQSRSYSEKLKDSLRITGAADSAFKFGSGTRGSGGVALNGTLSGGNPLTGEQVILNLTPQATEVDEMIEKTLALLQDMDTYLLKPEEEQDLLIAARIEKDRVRLQDMIQGYSPGYLQTMIPKWVPGFGGMTIPSLWTLYHRLPIFGKRLAAPNNIISWIGGPAGRELPPLMAARDIATRAMEMLRADAKGGPSQAKVNLATIAAMKAHGMDVTNSASLLRIKSHFNRIISQAQDAGSTAYKVGDFNAITGLEVLPADMEAVKAQKQLEDAVQKIARDAQAKGLTRSLFYDPLGIEEIISGRSVSRRSANYGLKMSRRANREQTPIINRWALATTPAKKIDILREHFDTMVLGLILETSPTLALKMDPLDKQLFNSLIEMERNNNLPFTDYDSFLSWWASERAAETGMTEAEERAESEARFIGYIDKSASQYGVDHAKKAQGVGTTAALDESRNLPPAVVRALSADNQFTRPRGALHGPSTWYTHDLTGAADQEAYKGSLLNTLAMRELSGWVNLRSAIGSALSTFDSRKKALMDSGVSEGEALKRIKVESREKADTLANEADYATLRDLSEHIDAAIAELSRIMGDTITTPADTGPVRTGRAILGVVGSQLLMPVEAMTNNTVGMGIMTTVVGMWLNRMRAYAAGPKYFAGMIKDMTGRVLNAAAKKNKPFKAWLKTNGPVVDALNELLAETTLRRDKANAAMTVDEADVGSLVKMIKELPSTYGVIDPGREQGLIEKSLNLLQAGMGVGQLKSYVPARYHSIIDKAATVSASAPYLLEQAKRIAPGTLDRAGNTAAGPLFDQMLNEPAFKQRMFAILERREATVPGWDNASSRNFRIPDEMWEGIFAVDNLKFMRDVLAPLGSLEALMVDWYKRVGGRKIAIQSEPFLTPEDEAAASFEFIKLTNMRTESTTPQVVKDKGSVFALWRAALSMFGRYSANNSGVMERRFARVAGTGEKESKWMAGLATLIMFLAFAIFGMELKGLWKDYGAREPRTAARLEVAVQDPKIAAQYTAAALSSFITYGGDILGKLAGGSMPSNPFDMTRSIPVLGIGTAAFNGVTTALQTGDPVYPMVDFMRTAFPVTKPVFNRIMEGDAGRREAYRGVRANAPSDIEMRQFSGGGGRATPMQPMIRSAINAYMEGDMEGYQSAYRKAVEYQVGRGKTAKAADQAVRSALASKDPIMSSVGRTLPDEDVERITQRLSPRQKNAFLRARSLTSSLRKGRGSKRTSPLRKRRQKAKRRTRRQA
jgi:hypothetical protein